VTGEAGVGDGVGVGMGVAVGCDVAVAAAVGVGEGVGVEFPQAPTNTASKTPPTKRRTQLAPDEATDIERYSSDRA